MIDSKLKLYGWVAVLNGNNLQSETINLVLAKNDEDARTKATIEFMRDNDIRHLDETKLEIIIRPF